METAQYTITCPQCGNPGFKHPDNAGPQALADGQVSCASCGRVLTIEDVKQLQANIANSQGPQDPVGAALAQAVRDILQ